MRYAKIHAMKKVLIGWGPLCGDKTWVERNEALTIFSEKTDCEACKSILRAPR